MPAGTGKVVIEKDVFIGPHCVILPNVTIGEGSVIRAGTVVTRSVPPHVLWGIPAATVLAAAPVPLTSEHGYRKFVLGLKQVGGRKPDEGESAQAIRPGETDGALR